LGEEKTPTAKRERKVGGVSSERKGPFLRPGDRHCLEKNKKGGKE